MKLFVQYWKHQTVYYDASTTEKRKESFTQMFDFFKSCHYYDCIEENEEDKQLSFFSKEKSEYELYQLALTGEIKHIINFLYLRQDYEYENWEEVETEN